MKPMSRPLSSRSLISRKLYSGFPDFLFLVAWRASLVLVGSRMLTDVSSMRTMSGLARVVLMLVGIVAGGESDALHIGLSAYRRTDAGSSFQTLERR